MAVPFAERIDAVFGLSNGPADAFTDLAAIVRFNPSGFIDVRKGSAYAADVSVPYRANDHFRVSMEIDFVRPARGDQDITITSFVRDFQGADVIIELDMVDAKGKTLAHGVMTCAHVDRQTQRASAWPADVAALFFEKA